MVHVQAKTPATSEASSRVVVKFSPALRLSHSENPEAEYSAAHASAWQALCLQFPGISLKAFFAILDAAALERLEQRAAAAGIQLRLNSYFAIVIPRGTDPAGVANAVAALPHVELAYVEGSRGQPAVYAADDPLSASQGYLSAAPVGIGARFVWSKQADGTGIGLVDLEQGWTLDHEDLPPYIPIIGSSQERPEWKGHGTAVLGVVAAVDNNKGVVGIAPRAAVRVVSQWFGTHFNTAEAIATAIGQMSAGDVLLVETTAPLDPKLGWVPAEVQPLVFDLIRVATSIGVTVVEPAGNNFIEKNGALVGNGSDLDTFTDGSGKFVLNRKSSDFRDSGAIMVGAASSSFPHRRLGFSNFGRRIDCYAWGENIATCGGNIPLDPTASPQASYTLRFGGTSGATAIIAGAAVLLQSWALKRLGHVFDTATLRALLSSPNLNTKSETPDDDRIGVMPDLHNIIQPLTIPPPLPEEVLKVFGGVAVDGPGFILIDGHLIRVPPRGPEMDMVLALAIRRLADEMSPAFRQDILGATSEMIKKVAEKELGR
jgi:hypothetical protein